MQTKKNRSAGRSDADIAAITRDLQELGVLEDVKALTRKHGVLLRAALGSARHKNVVLARDEIIGYLRERFGYSSSEVSVLLHVDHSTILVSTRRTKERTGKPKAIRRVK